jgi:hypothetical protein
MGSARRARDTLGAGPLESIPPEKPVAVGTADEEVKPTGPDAELTVSQPVAAHHAVQEGRGMGT